MCQIPEVFSLLTLSCRINHPTPSLLLSFKVKAVILGKCNLFLCRRGESRINLLPNTATTLNVHNLFLDSFLPSLPWHRPGQDPYIQPRQAHGTFFRLLSALLSFFE